MRRLLIVLVAVTFLLGASFIHADENGKGNDDDQGEGVLLSEVREVKDLLVKVLAELEKMNRAMAYGYPNHTVMSVLVEIRDALISSSATEP